MDRLKKDITNTIIYIDQYCRLIMLGKYDHANELMSALTASFSKIIPQILISYKDIEALQNDDGSVWKLQLGRILEALETDDDFKKLDILMYETKQLLVEYLSYLEQ